jgi:hypothetical protein
MSLSRWQDDIHALGSVRVSTTRTAHDTRMKACRFIVTNTEDVQDRLLILDALGLAPVEGEWT